MKTSFSLFAIRSAALGLAIAIAISAQGATAHETTNAPPAKAGKAGKKKAAAAAGNEAQLLDQAYGLLASADHDYDGHRLNAMHKIEDAAKALGSKLSGGGKGGEKQGTSDSQVKSAQSLLEQAVSGLKGKPHHHVEEAIRQLNVALKVK
jgi:mevalonate kinase